MSTIVRNNPLPMTPFTKKVMKLIKQIPKGKVATYGQIAALAGKPHGARGVGWILNSSSKAHRLPWQRVINSQGKISFPKQTSEYSLQKQLLSKEKVYVGENGAISLAEYGWKKKPSKSRRSSAGPGKRASSGQPKMFR